MYIFSCEIKYIIYLSLIKSILLYLILTALWEREAIISFFFNNYYTLRY